VASIMKQNRQRKGTVYVVRWYDASNKQLTKTFSRLEDAKRFARNAEAAKERGEVYNAKAGRTLYRDLATDWLEVKRSKAQKLGTIHGYESLLKVHVLPMFGDLPVRAIDAERVEAWVQDLSGNRGAGTVRNAFRNVLKPSLDYAVRLKVIPSNPATGTKLAQADHEEMCFLSAEEVVILADAIGEHYRPLILTAAYTGLRAGELAALRVGKLNLLRRTLLVDESAAAVTGQGIVCGPTKTYSKRSVPLPRPLPDLLTSYVADRADDPSAFVFVSPEGRRGRPLHHGNFYRRHFRPAVEKAIKDEKLPAHLLGLRFHDLRHTCASFMINDPNANPLLISKRLGHSSISVTYDRYGHVFPSNDEAVTEGLEARFAGATGQEAAQSA